MTRIELHNIPTTARPVSDPAILCYDRDGNEVDCMSSAIHRVHITECVAVGKPTLGLVNC